MTAWMRPRDLLWTLVILSVPAVGSVLPLPIPQDSLTGEAPWLSGFHSSAHHWLDLNDEDRVIEPRPDQGRYPSSEVASIADNVLLYQKTNGGWPKNYDMWAILTQDQIEALKKSKENPTTTFDNGATHSQVHYLAYAYRKTGDERYRDACLRGLDFILTAQYDNGGWPQTYPDRRGYRRHITFNDGAMIGVMRVLRRIVAGDPEFEFVDETRRSGVLKAYHEGLKCIMRCQIVEQGRPKAWCQQHDERDFRPRGARTFELASLASEESAEITLFLMSIEKPDTTIRRAISAAVVWFNEAALSGLRVKTIQAPQEEYRYHSTNTDRVLVEEPDAPPIWARYYELGTGRPLFSNRDGKPVYSLAEVERERRTGYGWYSYAPAEVLRDFPAWSRRWTLNSSSDLKRPESERR